MRSIYESRLYKVENGVCFNTGTHKYNPKTKKFEFCTYNYNLVQRNWVGCRDLHKSLIAFPNLIEENVEESSFEGILPCLYYVSDSFLKWIK